MYDTICTLPLTSDLFAQALHPTLPILTIALASGHVETYKLPPAADADDDENETDEEETTSTQKPETTNGSIISHLRHSSSAQGAIDTAWRTKRHKGSCRALAYTHDGESIYSAGTDGIVKAARTETGRVTSKFVIPQHNDEVDAPTVLCALTSQTLLLGTDSGRLYVHDLRLQRAGVGGKASLVWNPHGEDFVSSITPLPPTEMSTSGFPKLWVSTGGSTLAVTDLRKGVLRQSEDQEEELGCSCFVGGLRKGGTSVGQKVLVGQADGVLTLWERGVWDDQDERIVVDRAGSSVECVVEVPGTSSGRKIMAVGLEDGRVRFVRLGENKVMQDLDVRHDDIDGVTAIGFDVTGRMVTGGGQFVKVWHEAKGSPGGSRNGLSNAKRAVVAEDSNEDGDEDEENDSEQDEREVRGKRKKRKRNRGKDKTGGQQIGKISGLG